MKLVVAVVLAAVCCLAGLQLVVSRVQTREAEARSAALAAELAAVHAAAADETARRERLEARLAALEAARSAAHGRASASKGSSSSQDGTQGQPATAQKRAPAPGGAEPTGEDGASRRERIEAAVESLTARETKDSERQALWTSLGRDGLLDETLRAFEARVEAEPRNPDRHAELGAAYVQKILNVGDLEKGSWATKADRAFDHALELDPAHWEARFTKAASLAHWPPIFGKSAEAVRQFETLVAQQESRPAEPRFATTYLFLGNLYHNQGHAAKARETWARGAELFPRDSELRKQLAAAGGTE